MALRSLADLTPKQRRTLDALMRIGNRRRESFPEKVAGVATGLVEQNLENEPGGDLDSAGWRQERGHYGSVRNRLNLNRSVNRFYDETSQNQRRYPHYGDLAASVQRPAAQYRGRYRDRGEKAKALVRAWSRVHGGQPAAGRAGPARTKTVQVKPAVDRSSDRNMLLLNYLSERDKPGSLLSLGSGLQSAKDEPAVTRKVTVRSKGQAPGRGGGAAPKPAGGPENQIVQVGEFFKGKGYNIREHPRFDKVDPVHVQGSYHYKRRAIDVPVSGGQGRRFVEQLQRHFPHAKWIWNGPQPKNQAGRISYPHGHTGHVHVQI